MRCLHFRGRVGVTVHGICGDRVAFWLRGPRLFKHVEVRSPVVLSRRSWRYAIRQLGLRRALMARGFAQP